MVSSTLLKMLEVCHSGYGKPYQAIHCQRVHKANVITNMIMGIIFPPTGRAQNSGAVIIDYSAALNGKYTDSTPKLSNVANRYDLR
jgi:hypothetical protein